MFGNPVRGPRIVPFGSERLASDVLPNGHPGFRVTQTFDHLDAYWLSQGVYRKHNALDLGNFYCGDDVLAPADGIAHRLKDPYGALGVAVAHPNGLSTQSWHLHDYRATEGQKVNRGEVIGHVGGTGLAFGICHVHFMVWKDGVPIDPWPLLDQNAAPVKDHVKLNASDGINIRRGKGEVGTNNLAGVYATAVDGVIRRAFDSKVLLNPATARVRFGGYVNGARHGIEPYPYEYARYYLGSAYRYVARPLVTRVD